jgi:hypothetical protein
MSNKQKIKKPVTSVSDWKATNKPEPLELPSGNVALVKPAGMEAFLSAGMIPNSLLKIVTKALEAGQAQKADELDMAQIFAEIADDPAKLQSVFELADNATVYCVIEPKVNPLPQQGEDRDEALLYVDEVDAEDKLFIMNFAMGGTRALEPFREATSGGVGPVPTGDDVPRTAESASSDH